MVKALKVDFLKFIWVTFQNSVNVRVINFSFQVNLNFLRVYQFFRLDVFDFQLFASWGHYRILYDPYTQLSFLSMTSKIVVTSQVATFYNNLCTCRQQYIRSFTASNIFVYTQFVLAALEKIDFLLLKAILGHSWLKF